MDSHLYAQLQRYRDALELLQQQFHLIESAQTSQLAKSLGVFAHHHHYASHKMTHNLPPPLLLARADETLAKRTCLLLLDLHLLFHQPAQALEVTEFLERFAEAAGADDGSTAAGGEPSTASSLAPDALQIRARLHHYRARIHILSGAMKACKREIKSALNQPGQNPMALFLKSNFEYARRNYTKSFKQLTSCPQNVVGLVVCLGWDLAQVVVHFNPSPACACPRLVRCRCWLAARTLPPCITTTWPACICT